MHTAKRHYSTKIKSAKTFLKAFPRKFIPSKYTRYTVHVYVIYCVMVRPFTYKMSCRDVIACHVFPGSLTLREVRAALWSVRVRWFDLGLELGLPVGTLKVIEGHAVFLSIVSWNICLGHLILQFKWYNYTKSLTESSDTGVARLSAPRWSWLIFPARLWL